MKNTSALNKKDEYFQRKDNYSLLQDLIACPSLTPDKGLAQEILFKYLQKEIKIRGLDDKVQISFDSHLSHQTLNSHILMKTPNHLSSKKIAFIGHTDVVPARSEHWNSPPFELTEVGENFQGRGLVDMKGAIYCFAQAVLDYYSCDREQYLSISFFITGDEEGSSEHGLQEILEKVDLKSYQLGIIGEPSSSKIVGDELKVGRRGSLHGLLTLKGRSYHIAYPGNENPFYFLPEVLQRLQQFKFCENHNPIFPKTRLECSRITSEQTVENVTPSEITIRFNIRYNTSDRPSHIQLNLDQELKTLLEKTGIDYHFDWTEGATSWLSALSDKSIREFWPHKEAKHVTSGGLSDGWKVYKYGLKNLIECGLRNFSAHQANECCTKEDLKALENIYLEVLNNFTLLSKNP